MRSVMNVNQVIIQVIFRRSIMQSQCIIFTKLSSTSEFLFSLHYQSITFVDDIFLNLTSPHNKMQKKENTSEIHYNYDF